jgi:hypothetical protein
MSLEYSRWLFGEFFVHFLAMYLQCTGSGHHPLPPVLFASHSSFPFVPRFTHIICTIVINPRPWVCGYYCPALFASRIELL